MYYAYLITNNVNKKVYVGISKDPTNRWQRHQSNARSTSTEPRYNTYLYSSMRKYGIKNFSFKVIATFEERSECELYEVTKIQYFRDNLIGNYNIHDGGTLGCDMRKHVNYKQWKDSLKEAHTERAKDHIAWDSWKTKLKEKRKGRTPALGMKHTDEAKQIASEVSNKYWDTQETFARDPEKVQVILALSHREAKKQFGISTTHYYRLKKRFATNDSK